jgi:hypothetical protein
MNNFFLFNEAIDLDDLVIFKSGINNLIEIKDESDEIDAFLKHETIWNNEICLELFADPSQQAKAIIVFIEQLKEHKIYLANEEVFDSEFSDMSNAFLGIDFSDLKIDTSRQVICKATFQKFKDENLWKVTFRNFWSRRKLLFPNITLCGDVKEQIAQIGNSSYFNQIVEKLKILNNAVKKWKTGDFSYKLINTNYALNISPESEKTMTKFGNERIFSLPSGAREHFELHIKTGDLRFHFYPDNLKKIVYIGYIGPHLPTISN